MPKPGIEAWRIDKEKWKDASFDGSGAAREGGRWNSAGVRVVYASEHLAMASLEKYVHLPKPVPATMRFVRFRIELGEVAIRRLAISDLPGDWQVSPPSDSTQKIGDAWVGAGETAVLAVPSALIPEETNFLLNPAHPDFKRIVVHPCEAFAYSPRVARLIEPAKK